jgi:hypothetical protein
MNNETRFFQIPFIPIPPSLYDEGNGVNAAAMAVWGALAKWADKDGKCWRPIRLLAQDIKQSESSVKRAIKALKKAGFLKVTLHRGAHSEYCLIWRGSDVASMQTTEESEVTGNSLRRRGSDVASMKTTEESEVTGNSLLQQRERNGKWGHRELTSEVTGTHDLYVVSKEKDSSLFSLAQVGKPESAPDKEQANRATDPPNADWPCSYVDGRWHTGSELTAWLRRRHSDVNVEIIIERTAVSLQANGAPNIKHGLSFLDYYCEHPFETVSTGWEDTTEFIVQGWRRGQKAKRRVMKAGGSP